jgi:hypothetical protein
MWRRGVPRTLRECCYGEWMWYVLIQAGGSWSLAGIDATTKDTLHNRAVRGSEFSYLMTLVSDE